MVCGIVGIDASVEGFREFRADGWGEGCDVPAMAINEVDYEPQVFCDGSTFRRIIKSRSESRVPISAQMLGANEAVFCIE